MIARNGGKKEGRRWYGNFDIKKVHACSFVQQLRDMTKDRETLEEHHATALERLQEKQGELSQLQTVNRRTIAIGKRKRKILYGTKKDLWLWNVTKQGRIAE